MQALEAVASLVDRRLVMPVPVVATVGFEVVLDLLEELVELIQRRNAAVAQLIDESAQFVVEVAEFEDLVWNPEQRFQGEENREDDAMRMSRDITSRIELAGETPDVSFQLDVQVPAPTRHLTRLEGGEDAKSLERRRLQAQSLIGLQIGRAERFHASLAVRLVPARFGLRRLVEPEEIRTLDVEHQPGDRFALGRKALEDGTQEEDGVARLGGEARLPGPVGVTGLGTEQVVAVEPDRRTLEDDLIVGVPLRLTPDVALRVAVGVHQGRNGGAGEILATEGE